MPYGVGHTRGSHRAAARPRRRSRRRRRARPRTAAIGGRFGPRRTTSSREYTTRTGATEPVGELARRARCAPSAALPPNAPPFASGDAGSPPGSHHDASGSRYAGSTHDVASRTPPGGQSGSGRAAAARVDGRAPALHLAGAGARFEQRLGRRPTAARPRRPRRRRARRERHRDERVARARCRRRTARRRAERRHRRAARRRLRARRAPRRGRRDRVGTVGASPRDRVVRPSASRCTGRGARRAPGRDHAARSPHATRMTMPGRAEAALRAAARRRTTPPDRRDPVRDPRPS